jgi:uncharacterized membrane protein
MKRWILPIALFGVTACAAWYATVAAVPAALMKIAISRLEERGGSNVMAHGNLSTPANQPVVRPSPDLAYSTCPFDLSKGAVLITHVPVVGRYSSLSVFDARTDVAFVRNDAQAQGKPYQVALAREGQAVPKGVTVVRLKYDRGIALIRLLLNAPSEIAALDPARRQSTCRVAS